MIRTLRVILDRNDVTRYLRHTGDIAKDEFVLTVSTVLNQTDLLALVNRGAGRPHQIAIPVEKIFGAKDVILYHHSTDYATAQMHFHVFSSQNPVITKWGIPLPCKDGFAPPTISFLEWQKGNPDNSAPTLNPSGGSNDPLAPKK